MRPMSSLKEVESVIEAEPLALVYLSREQCSVCHALKPQLEQWVLEESGLQPLAVSVDDIPEAAGRFEVFTAPAVILFAEGREKWRGARFVREEEVRKVLRQWNDLLDGHH
ncbi:thioredoxin family protein [Alkalicoccus luteus]|uniref:Thioredoxin family protein n=1 Tax=Alkalicoccus luteus TaxID=1237094 RepID=A0A969PS72_9BACI|nr:thioredoxin family protein [Alkalicoccus luteus]NJP38099.1 thioredoxin family protein [Alkalicoccus luteus]